MKEEDRAAAHRASSSASEWALARSAVGVWLPLALVTVLGLFLRLYRLGAEGLFPDEGISIEHARNFHWDNVRPLYFLLLHLWLRLGDSEAMLRMPAALMGAATVPLVYLLGQRLFNPRAGLVAALLVAVSPIHLNHSQEIRMYSQVTLFAVASFLCFHSVLTRGRARDFVGYGAATVAALLTQPVSLFILAAQNLYLLGWCRRHRRLATWWLLAQAAVVLVALPFVHGMAGQAAAFAQDWVSTRAKPTAHDIVWLLSDLSFWKRSLFFGFGAPAYIAYYTLLLGTLALLLAAPLLMRKREPEVTLALAWFVVPLLCALIISYTVVNIWQVRYLIYVLPAYALLIGFSVDRLARHAAGGPAVVFAGLVALAGLGIDGRYYKEEIHADWNGAMAYIQVHRRPGDGFGIYADQIGPAFGYYADRAGIPPEDWVALGLQPRVFRELTPPELRRLFAELPPGRRRYWLFLMHYEHRGGASIQQYAEKQYTVLAHPTQFRYIDMMLFTSGAQTANALRGDGP